MQNRAGSMPSSRQHRRVGLGIFLQHDLDVFEVVSEPAGRDLVGLVDEVALGDQDQPPRRADFGQHLGNVIEQPHRILELPSDHLDHLGDRSRGNSAAADGDGGLDHRQPERLDAISERGQVLAFGGSQRRLDIDTVGRVRRDQLDESLLVGSETVLAVPQGVVGVEADHVERTHRRLTPSISSRSPSASPARSSIRRMMSVLPST